MYVYLRVRMDVSALLCCSKVNEVKKPKFGGSVTDNTRNDLRMSNTTVKKWLKVLVAWWEVCNIQSTFHPTPVQNKDVWILAVDTYVAFNKMTRSLINPRQTTCTLIEDRLWSSSDFSLQNQRPFFYLLTNAKLGQKTKLGRWGQHSLGIEDRVWYIYLLGCVECNKITFYSYICTICELPIGWNTILLLPLVTRTCWMYIKITFYNSAYEVIWSEYVWKLWYITCAVDITNMWHVLWNSFDTHWNTACRM